MFHTVCCSNVATKMVSKNLIHCFVTFFMVSTIATLPNKWCDTHRNDPACKSQYRNTLSNVNPNPGTTQTRTGKGRSIVWNDKKQDRSSNVGGTKDIVIISDNKIQRKVRARSLLTGSQSVRPVGRCTDHPDDIQCKNQVSTNRKATQMKTVPRQLTYNVKQTGRYRALVEATNEMEFQKRWCIEHPDVHHCKIMAEIENMESTNDFDRPLYFSGYPRSKKPHKAKKSDKPKKANKPKSATFETSEPECVECMEYWCIENPGTCDQDVYIAARNAARKSHSKTVPETGVTEETEKIEKHGKTAKHAKTAKKSKKAKKKKH